MKKDIHPDYQDILFIDTSTGTKFICGSTLQPKEREIFEGKEYPLYHITVSSASHPFFTGSKQFIDTEGRVDKFLKRYSKKQELGQKQAAEQEEKKKKASEKKPVKKKKKK
ncbi:MAG: type B 50S ribosomal protein L31 [Chlamydiales bacterium]